MKRGQAALEFLSTYGFAFLLILVMIGALAYFGVLNPQRFLPERCTFGNELDCRDFQLDRVDDSSTDISLFLANQVGNTIKISEMRLNSDFGAANCTFGPEISISAGEASTLDCSIGDEFPAEGEKAKVSVDLIWIELGGRFNHTTRGEIFATLQ